MSSNTTDGVSSRNTSERDDLFEMGFQQQLHSGEHTAVIIDNEDISGLFHTRVSFEGVKIMQIEGITFMLA